MTTRKDPLHAGLLRTGLVASILLLAPPAWANFAPPWLEPYHGMFATLPIIVILEAVCIAVLLRVPLLRSTWISLGINAVTTLLGAMTSSVLSNAFPWKLFLFGFLASALIEFVLLLEILKKDLKRTLRASLIMHLASYGLLFAWWLCTPRVGTILLLRPHSDLPPLVRLKETLSLAGEDGWSWLLHQNTMLAAIGILCVWIAVLKVMHIARITKKSQSPILRPSPPSPPG